MDVDDELRCVRARIDLQDQVLKELERKDALLRLEAEMLRARASRAMATKATNGGARELDVLCAVAADTDNGGVGRMIEDVGDDDDDEDFDDDANAARDGATATKNSKDRKALAFEPRKVANRFCKMCEKSGGERRRTKKFGILDTTFTNEYRTCDICRCGVEFVAARLGLKEEMQAHRVEMSTAIDTNTRFERSGKKCNQCHRTVGSIRRTWRFGEQLVAFSSADQTSCDVCVRMKACYREDQAAKKSKSPADGRWVLVRPAAKKHAMNAHLTRCKDGASTSAGAPNAFASNASAPSSSSPHPSNARP